MPAVYKTISGTDESEPLELAGYCDIYVLGITSGQVELKIKFPEDEDYRVYPEATFTDNTAQSIFISGKGIMGKLVATGCNSGVYLRLDRHYNN